jgi:hypothetical protein
MNGIDFEYAIKKDVRNNPIVRELDEARHRQLWRSAAIGAVLVVVLLFSAWQHFELIHHGYVMEQLHQQKGASKSKLSAPPDGLKKSPSRNFTWSSPLVTTRS